MNANEIIRVINDSETFRLRTEFALTKYALAVMAEGTGVTNHTARVEFAKKVLAGNLQMRPVVISMFASNAIANAANESAVAQADIDTQIAATFNAHAGIG